MSKINLLNFDRASLRDYFKSLGEKPYHADQIIQWVHQYGHDNFDEMTNLSRALRSHLAEHAAIVLPKIVTVQISEDQTRKWLLELEDKQLIEMVYIPEDERGTLCISSQVGCPLACEFCATGGLGYKRNLSVAEIIGQVWLAVRELSNDNKRHDRKVTNIVFMGMGEPLLNLEAVLPAINLLEDDLAYCFSKYRVTVSTVGIVPAMDELSKKSDVSLAVSLHAPNNALRSRLMPINQKYPLEELMPACQRFFKDDKRRKVSFEYIMIKDVNDSLTHAKELVKLLAHVPAKINLIPCNPVPHLSFLPTPQSQIDAFRQVLKNAGFNTITRKRRGADIDAACGQLAGTVDR